MHIEGPFINPDRKRGIHEADRIRQLDEGGWSRPAVRCPRAGRVVLTLAPEKTSASRYPHGSSSHGVIVARGTPMPPMTIFNARDRCGADRLHPFVQRDVAADPRAPPARSARRLTMRRDAGAG
jgi:hypothetical protein